MSRRAAFCLVSMLCTFFLVLGFAVVSFAEETVDAPPASSVEAAATAGASSSNEDDVLLIEEPAEEGEVGGEGRAPEPSALASESIDSEAIDWIDFLFIETPEMALGGTERIAIGFTDSQVIGSASIEVADSNGTTWDVSAKTIEDGAALFEIGQDLGLTDGEYRIAAVTFEADGETRVVDLSDESASAVFAVMGQSDARSLSLDDMVSTTFVSADNDDQITSSGSIESVLGSLQSYGLKSRSAESVAKPTVVVLDAGHGGLDSGTVANGIIESNVTLKIAKYCRQELESRGYSVVMTRSDDSYVALEDRAEIARNAGAGLFVSFHINQGGGQGVEVWIPAKSTWYSSFHEFGETLGNKILAKLEALGFDSRGLISDYYSNNPDGSAGDYLSVIRNCRKYGIPAVLIEHGFIDNYHDVTYLKNEANLKKIGIADAEAIASVTLPGGLIEDGEGLRFLQSDGTYLCSAWKEWEGKTYYFDEDGYALVHRQTIGGKRYYFNARGELQTGWVVWVDGSGRPRTSTTGPTDGRRPSAGSATTSAPRARCTPGGSLGRPTADAPTSRRTALP